MARAYILAVAALVLCLMVSSFPVSCARLAKNIARLRAHAHKPVPAAPEQPDDAELYFLAMGDWGGQPTAPYTTPAELSTAAQMASTIRAASSQPVPVNFVFGLGDNFYDAGVKNVDDPRFKVTFEDVFSDPAFNLPFYLIAGNHDHVQNATAQVAYSAKSKRWNFPALYYTFTKNVTSPSGSGAAFTVQFVMIDTVRLDDGDPDQLTWIENTLKASTATWVIVAGHFPVYSVAEHGPTQSLITYVKPLMEKYGVASYLCGHDHNLQHLFVPSSTSGLHYYLTGAAHGYDYNLDHAGSVPANSLQFYHPPGPQPATEGGFITVRINGTALNVQYIDSNGTLLYVTSQGNPRTKLVQKMHLVDATIETQ